MIFIWVGLKGKRSKCFNIGPNIFTWTGVSCKATKYIDMGSLKGSNDQIFLFGNV